MDKVWLKNYPQGIAHQIDPDVYSSLVDIFNHSCEHFQSRPAFSNFGRTLTFGELDTLSRAFAAFTQNELGLVKGDRIAIMLPNLLQYPVALFGALRAGLTVVNTNPLYTDRELGHQLSDSGASAIVVLENFAHVLEKCIDQTQLKHVVITRMGDLLPFPKSMLMNLVIKYVKKMVPAYVLHDTIGFKDALEAGANSEFKAVELNHSDLAFLQYTGGTTGVAKGAMLSHGNMVANVEQASAWIRSVIAEEGDLVITALPLYHIFSLTANCMTFMKSGSHNYLITNPRDMPGFVKEIKSLGFSVITGVNTLFNGLLNTPGFEQVDFSKLNITFGGGMAVQHKVAERWKQVTGCPLIEAYGLTETSPAACMNPMNLKDYNGFIGLPISSTEVQVVDDAGNVAALGEPGELCIRGPQVMQGYWQRPEATAEVLSQDGWLRTGDVGIMNSDGYFKIVDRKKDMILVSGFNVYPNEIEDVVAGHPDVAEVGVIGIPDERSGEVVKMIVVKKNPALTAEALQAFCSEELTGYKRPKYIQFVKELPKSNVGKILRRELRDNYSNTDC